MDQLPCALAPGLFGSDKTAADAAELCDRCPIASECLLEALRLDGAYRAGEDYYGITGVCGGVWFEPGRQPIALARRATTGSAPRARVQPHPWRRAFTNQ